MKKIFILLLINFIFSINHSLAQTHIVGKLLNNEKEAIPFATIALLKAIDSSIVKGNITTDKGEYEFEKVQVGKYLIKAMVVGMEKTVSKPFEINNTQKEVVLEDIVVQKSGVDLQAVDIVAIKPLVEFKNGNITLNVENSTLAAGNSVYDLLKRAPGVTIDNNNNISIQGKKGVKIMIDGRMQQLSPDQLANMLQSMSAEGISSIEIMKNPSVKYDAEGTAGIIQIKTKKAKLIGFNGNVNAGISRGEFWSGNAGFALNYKAEKFAITSNFNAIQRNRLTTVLLNRRIKTSGEDLIFDQKSVETKQNQANDYKLGVDWFVNNKTTIGLVWDGGTGSPNESGKNITNILGNNTVGFNYLEALSTVKNSWNNNNININALHKLDTLGAEMDASFNYTKYQEKGNNSYGNYFYDASNNLVSNLFPNVYKNTIHSDINMFIGALNFKKPLAKKTTIETGLKYSGVNTNNDFLFERKDTSSNNYYNDINYSNNFLYLENVAAGYFNYQKGFKKLSMQLGLRGEYTHATGFNKTINSKIIREYFQLFPNISFDYKASEKHAIQFSYNRRINRPDYFQLNPFKYYIDQYTANQGNPFLNPETSHNLTLTHSFMGALYNTLSYSRTENSIMELISQNDNTKETTQISKNINSVNQFAYNLFAYVPIKKIYVAQLDFSAWYQSFEGNVNGVNFNFGKPSFQVSLTNEFILPKEFSVEFSGQYTGALQYGIMQLKPQGSVDIGIKKILCKNKLTLKLNASDLFYTNITRVASTFDNQNFTFKQYADTRRVRFTITYNFGNTKLKFEQHNKGNEAENNRLKKN
jgi:iron complex outermembrane receptor protein